MNYTAIYNALMYRCKDRERPGEYCELHHILPKCLGGLNDSDNLVYLTYREHTLAHWLLHRIHPENSDLAFSLHILVYARTKYKYYKPSRILLDESYHANIHGQLNKIPKVKKVKTRKEWVPGVGFTKIQYT